MVDQWSNGRSKLLKQTFALGYVCVYCFYSACTAATLANDHQENRKVLNTLSQQTTYAALLNNGHATLSKRQTRGEGSSHPHQAIIYLMATLERYTTKPRQAAFLSVCVLLCSCSCIFN